MIYSNGYPKFTQTQTRICGYPKLRVPESSGTSMGSTAGNPKSKKPKKPDPKFRVNPNAQSYCRLLAKLLCSICCLLAFYSAPAACLVAWLWLVGLVARVVALAALLLAVSACFVACYLQI
ncbi:hypothetical protein Zm00014a_027293 [Zea mays]|uniref:Transmembrane protein n=1 Tax=Zea mays TaxID=4577 RepID=A0A3L6D6T8_MAIZE|nr:hypothetical protein Zm00014a_027293 [Zea mays]